MDEEDLSTRSSDNDNFQTYEKSNFFSAGSVFSSTITIISVTLGMGSISFAYAIMKTGYILGPIFTLFCGLISY